MLKAAFSVLIIAVISGCASIPTDPTQQGEYYAKQAASAFSSGDQHRGYAALTQAVTLPSGAPALKKLLGEDKAASEKLVQSVIKRFETLDNPWTAAEISRVLASLSAGDVLEARQMLAMKQNFAAVVGRLNATGKISFVADQYTLQISELASLEHRRIILDRTISAYSDSHNSERDMSSVVKLVHTEGSSQELIDRLRANLPRMNVRASEIALVASIDPNFANKRTAEITLKAHLIVKNTDRLFVDDLATHFKNTIKGVEWLGSPSSADYVVSIERVRDTEKQIPPTSRTVTYAQHEVDLVSAALLMPRGASYQYEIKTGGSEIDYGYIVSISKNGLPMAESVARGKLGGAASSCENARIVNVFGGVTAAGFTANEDMRRTCANPTGISLDELRKELLEKIAIPVRAVPAIQTVHEANI